MSPRAGCQCQGWPAKQLGQQGRQLASVQTWGSVTSCPCSPSEQEKNEVRISDLLMYNNKASISLLIKASLADYLTVAIFLPRPWDGIRLLFFFAFFTCARIPLKVSACLLATGQIIFLTYHVTSPFVLAALAVSTFRLGAMGNIAGKSWLGVFCPFILILIKSVNSR